MMEGILGNLINEVKITHSYLTRWLPHGSSISSSDPLPRYSPPQAVKLKFCSDFNEIQTLNFIDEK